MRFLFSRLRSFRYAIAGLGFVLRSQHNAWVHLAITILVIATGLFLRIGSQDWKWVILCIALVWFAEVINTAFEYLCDVVSPDYSQHIEKAKDIAAGAVLVCAIAATLIGILVFAPYVFS